MQIDISREMDAQGQHEVAVKHTCSAGETSFY